MFLPAVKADPSLMLEVSLKGLSVPLTSWWSRLMTMGALTSPLATASLKALAMAARPSWSE